MLSSASRGKHVSGPILLTTISGFDGEINDAIFIKKSECILSGSNDRSLRLWMKRESGRFWPSVEEVLPSPVSILCFETSNNTIHMGLMNGTIVEYTIPEDLSCFNHIRDILAHTNVVTDLYCNTELSLIFSTSKDRTVAWFNYKNGNPIGSMNLDAILNCLQFDVKSKCLFVGDYTGRIILLNFDKASDFSYCEVIKELRGHVGSVISLSWHKPTSRLISSSDDKTIVMWDIGSGKGSAYELQGHTQAVTSIMWLDKSISKKFIDNNSESLSNGEDVTSSTVISGSLDGLLYFWFMDVERRETPTWNESDICQLCSTPFFWNVRKMWSISAIGVRQHHCRRCGKAVCERCSPHLSEYPIMGFEREVRVCKECFREISREDCNKLAESFDTHHPVIRVRLSPSQNVILTVGKNKEVKVWDISSVI